MFSQHDFTRQRPSAADPAIGREGRGMSRRRLFRAAAASLAVACLPHGEAPAEEKEAKNRVIVGAHPWVLSLIHI